MIHVTQVPKEAEADMDSQGRKGQNQRLLAFFGSDVEDRSPELLREAFSKGYTVLALDASAIGIATKAKVPYTLIDDWIDSTAMLQAREKAAACEQRWFQAARDKFTLDRVCWPEFDHHAMNWFWADIMLAMALVETFRACDVQEVTFFQSHSRRPAVYYSPSDVSGSLWEAELPGVAKPYKLQQATSTILQKLFSYRLLRYTRSRVGKVVRQIRRRSTTVTVPSAIRGKVVVLAFNPGEFHRFTPVIRQLYKSLPGKIAAAILSPDQATADRIAAEWSIPVALGPSSIAADPAPGQQFLRGYAQALDAAGGQPWQKPLKHLQFHFEYYCKQRWPMLADRLRFWSELWRVACPKAVLVSQLQDSESQLPAEAAKHLGIPALSISHGAGPGRPRYVVPSTCILYSLSTQRSVFERSGVPAHRLIACRDVVVENEYPVIPIRMGTARHAWRLLALTDPIGSSGCLSPTTSPIAQLEALRTLDSPPTDIAKKLSLKIKVHPKYTDVELFGTVSNRLSDNVLPPDSELKSVLKDTDLVVAVNYCGSALVHVLRAGKPLVLFWTDFLIGKVEPHAHADLFLPAGTLVRNLGEFWDLVRRFFTDSEVGRRMRLKAQEFCRNNLDDSNYPGIDEVVDGILSSGYPHHSRKKTKYQ